MSPEFRNVRLDRLFREVKQRVPFESTVLLTPSTVHGVVPQSSLDFRPQQALRENYEVTPVRVGDFVVSMSSYRHGMEYCGMEGGISPDYTVLRPLVDSDTVEFLRYALKSRVMIEQLTLFRSGIRVGQRLQWNRIRYLEIPVPTREYTRMIAPVLDRETAVIDQLIEKKQRLLRLLGEKRAQTISKFVDQTKLVEGRRAKLGYFLTKIGSGKTPRGGSEVYVESGVRFLRSQNIYDDGLRLDDVAFIAPAVDHEMASTRVRSDDLLLNITGASIGRCVVVTANALPANVNQHVCILRPSALVEPEFLHLCITSRSVQEQLRREAFSGNREGLNFSEVRGLLVTVPYSLGVQRRLVQDCREALEPIRRVAELTENSIERLTELRTSLITAAVTGQLDISAWTKRGRTERRLEAVETVV